MTQTRKRRKPAGKRKDTYDGKITQEQYNIACLRRRNCAPRLCGFLDDLETHMAYVTRVTYNMKCEVCGKPCHQK